LVRQPKCRGPGRETIISGRTGREKLGEESSLGSWVVKERT